MKTKITLILILLVFVLSCNSKISLPDNFTPTPADALLIVDLTSPFEVGFVNPSYYISDKRKRSAEELIKRIKPKSYIIEALKECLTDKFKGSLLKIKKTLIDGIPYMPKVGGVPKVREPKINPDIDLAKLLKKYSCRYVILFRIRHLRLELDVRPFVYDKIEIEPVLAVYDTLKGKKIYLNYLGTKIGLHKEIIAFTFKEHENSEYNVGLFKKKALELSSIVVNELTKGLKGLF